LPLSSSASMRRSLAASCGLTPLVSLRVNSRSRPLCRKRRIILKRKPSPDGCQSTYETACRIVWRAITAIGRVCDRDIFVYRALFSPVLFSACQAFIKMCFKENASFGKPAQIRPNINTIATILARWLEGRLEAVLYRRADYRVRGVRNPQAADACLR
jgi:hypothetical protein